MAVASSKAWLALGNYYLTHLSCKSTASLFEIDGSTRSNNFSLLLDGLFIDFSKNKLDLNAKALLIDLAKQQNLNSWIEKLFTAKIVNDTENRPALHTLLRSRSSKLPKKDKKVAITKKMIDEQYQLMAKVVCKIRGGDWRGATGKKITDVVNIGVGGSDLGPLAVAHALQNTDSPIRLHYISSIDGTQFANLLKKINQECSLFIIASKSFSTIDTMANAETVLQWFKEKISDEEAILSQHFIGVSANKNKMSNWGIPKANQLLFWDWIGGRYSLWSCIGLSIALKIGMEGFDKFLEGANKMDEHFVDAPFEENIPVMMALINIWNINFLGINNKVILPYDARLKYLPAYLTQLIMESNGKSVDRAGNKIDYKTCPIIWGEVGSNAQHAFFQLLHQGTQKVMCDFIAVVDRDDFDTKSEGKKELSLQKQHDLALANCFAQSRALMMGNKAIPENLKGQFNSVFKSYPGDQPSNTILMDSVSPENMGMLIAMYEHITFVESVIWNINPFDQWGVELGKLIAQDTYDALQCKNDEKSFDSSTNALINKVKR